MPNQSASCPPLPSPLAPMQEATLPVRKGEPSFILAVTRNGHMAEPVMEYALTVAQRLGYAILAVHVDTLPLFNRSRRSRLFAAAMEESTALLAHKAKEQGVAVEHLGEFGKIDAVIGRLCRGKRRIEFVVLDKGIRVEEVARTSPVPVFPVRTVQQGLFCKTLSHAPKPKGVFTMSATSKKQYVQKCALFGALTVGLYAAVFTHQELIMQYFSKGGVYAVLPVLTVFAVSYLHGNFTSSFWSALGIEASKKTVGQRVESPKTETVGASRPDTRPRVQAKL